MLTSYRDGVETFTLQDDVAALDRLQAVAQVSTSCSVGRSSSETIEWFYPPSAGSP